MISAHASKCSTRPSRVRTHPSCPVCGSVRSMNYDKKAMTAFAQAALATSELIGAKFANTTFSGQVNRTVKVVAPQVESTQGGKQARESINLVPTDNDPSRTITCGFLDVGLRSAEIRSYASLNMLHRQRYNQPLDLHQSD